MSDFDEPSLRDWEQRRQRRRMAEDDLEDEPASGRSTVIDEARRRRPVNPSWRRERSARARSRRSATAIYASPQEFQLWLQRGGWMWFAIGAVFVIGSLIFFMWQSRSEARNNLDTNPFAVETPLTDEPEAPAAAPLLPQPTVTAAAAPSTSDSAAAFVVFNTNTQGLFLRSEPGGDVLETLPEGTRVEQIGDDQLAADYVWRHVRAPSGQEGWVAADWLQPAP